MYGRFFRFTPPTAPYGYKIPHKKLTPVEETVRVATPVMVNGRKHYVDLRPLHYAYLLATRHDGSIGIYLCTPDGSIEKDECSLIEGVRDAA